MITSEPLTTWEMILRWWAVAIIWCLVRLGIRFDSWQRTKRNEEKKPKQGKILWWRRG
jgi:hypothetical protein